MCQGSVCCKSGLKNHFCCPRGSQCDNYRGACITIKKVKPSKADIVCGSCDYGPPVTGKLQRCWPLFLSLSWGFLKDKYIILILVHVLASKVLVLVIVFGLQVFVLVLVNIVMVLVLVFGLWSLDDVTSAPSLSTFRRHLKTYLFRCCYNTLWFCCTYSDYSGPRSGVAA